MPSVILLANIGKTARWLIFKVIFKIVQEFRLKWVSGLIATNPSFPGDIMSSGDV